MLTWEFPPFIAGGLGMACYGLAKGLLSMGVEINLMLPTRDEVYFPLRKVEDADIMPIVSLGQKDSAPTEQLFKVQNITNLRERLEAVGASIFPESYFTTASGSVSKYYDLLSREISIPLDSNIEKISTYLTGEEPLFKKVQEFSERVIKYSDALNCDLIHAHDWLTYPAGVAVKNILKVPLISHIHATEFDRAGGPGDERIHNIEYAGMSEADSVVAVSKYTAALVIDRYRIKPKKIKVVHNAYSVSNDTINARRRIFKSPLVLFLGRITIQKGPDYFVRVAEKVLKECKDVFFVMAGSGDMFSGVLKSAASRRLKERFLFTGFLNREKVEDILCATDIFVLPSVSEPFGIVPLEAMAFGAATIVSKQSGVAEVIENVYKVDFWDVDQMSGVIIDLLKNPEKRDEMARLGKAEVLRIGWNKAAEKLVNVYKRHL